jgi:hypothetical protein
MPFPPPLQAAMDDPTLSGDEKLRLCRAWHSDPASFSTEYAAVKAYRAQTAATLAARSERTARRTLEQTAPGLDDEIKLAIIKVMTEMKCGATEAAAVVGRQRAKP